MLKLKIWYHQGACPDFSRGRNVLWWLHQALSCSDKAPWQCTNINFHESDSLNQYCLVDLCIGFILVTWGHNRSTPARNSEYQDCSEASAEPSHGARLFRCTWAQDLGDLEICCSFNSLWFFNFSEMLRCSDLDRSGNAQNRTHLLFILGGSQLRSTPDSTTSCRLWDWTFIILWAVQVWCCGAPHEKATALLGCSWPGSSSCYGKLFRD